MPCTAVCQQIVASATLQFVCLCAARSMGLHQPSDLRCWFCGGPPVSLQLRMHRTHEGLGAAALCGLQSALCVPACKLSPMDLCSNAWCHHVVHCCDSMLGLLASGSVAGPTNDCFVPSHSTVIGPHRRLDNSWTPVGPKTTPHLMPSCVTQACMLHDEELIPDYLLLSLLCLQFTVLYYTYNTILHVFIHLGCVFGSSKRLPPHKVALKYATELGWASAKALLPPAVIVLSSGFPMSVTFQLSLSFPFSLPVSSVNPCWGALQWLWWTSRL